MDVGMKVGRSSNGGGQIENIDLGFLPGNLTRQCRAVIESYHEMHGFACLPDVLWKSRLGPFIEKHKDLRQILRRASTTRSAKKSNEGFIHIATTILSLEILASSFLGWDAIYPDAADAGRAIHKRIAGGHHMPLTEFYLYPSKYISVDAIATLAPPSAHPAAEVEAYRTEKADVMALG